MLLNINGKVFFMLIKKPISPSQLAKGQHRIILGKMLGSFLNEETPTTCIWSIYLSVDTIFQSFWFLSGFP
jgi:hypothetical protein